MGVYRLEEGLNSPFPFHEPSFYSVTQRQTLPTTLLRANVVDLYHLPGFWATVGRTSLRGSAHPSCTSQSSAPYLQHQETCTQDQTRTETLRNTKAAEKPPHFLSHLLFFPILPLFAVFECACTEQNHSVSGVQHWSSTQSVAEGGVAQFALPREVLCLRPR